jgi:succinate dehydrogenase/fumarate reductase flavoprotein subunit
MKQYRIKVSRNMELPVTEVHTLIIGSGAAGLNAAVQLHREGITDILIVTEGLNMGTSINTGSDKQTYYKTAMCGTDQDSPMAMAVNYYSPGGVHGDLALVEAALSSRAFLSLVNLGVKFPTDAYGQFAGYKTDHDPARRGTSVGPYTSRDMCRALIAEVKRRNITVLEKMDVVSLLTDEGAEKRILGALALDSSGSLTGFAAGNVVFAVGGPGGLYESGVYPAVHTGGIGMALRAGAAAQGLPESQYGLASVKFPWNVSGSYMQVVPKFISTGADGKSGAVEFLREYFTGSRPGLHGPGNSGNSGNSGGPDPGSPGGIARLHSLVFLKGYQWPFDSKKIPFGSSLIDILVYIETVVKGRRVFLDFRENPEDFEIEKLDEEARIYLEKSGALQSTPIDRLEHMNPGAAALYRDHNIDIRKEMLEIAVCAQHNNGGLAGNHWWESVNIRGLYPVGEVNGSHGGPAGGLGPQCRTGGGIPSGRVHRPGGRFHRHLIPCGG